MSNSVKMNEKVCFTCFLEALSVKIDSRKHKIISDFWKYLQNNGVKSQPVFEGDDDVFYLTWRKNGNVAEIEIDFPDGWENREIILDGAFLCLDVSRNPKCFGAEYVKELPLEVIDFLKTFND